MKVMSVCFGNDLSTELTLRVRARLDGLLEVLAVEVCYSRDEHYMYPCVYESLPKPWPQISKASSQTKL